MVTVKKKREHTIHSVAMPCVSTHLVKKLEEKCSQAQIQRSERKRSASSWQSCLAKSTHVWFSEHFFVTIEKTGGQLLLWGAGRGLT